MYINWAKLIDNFRINEIISYDTIIHAPFNNTETPHTLLCPVKITCF